MACSLCSALVPCPSDPAEEVTALFVTPKIKNNHLNQAVHEEREAIIELRVQLRLLQMQRAKSEQQLQEEEEPERRGGIGPPPCDGVLEVKAAKEQVKPSPSKDRKETPI